MHNMKNIILYLLAAILAYPIANFEILRLPRFEYEGHIRIFVSGPALILLGVILMKSNTARIHRYIGVAIAALGLIYTGLIVIALLKET